MVHNLYQQKQFNTMNDCYSVLFQFNFTFILLLFLRLSMTNVTIFVYNVLFKVSE